MLNNSKGRLLAAILLICAISFTACTVKKKGADSLIDKPDDKIETVDISGPDEMTASKLAALSPEERARIEEEELTRKSSLGTMGTEDLTTMEQSIIQDIFFEYDRSDLSASSRDILAAIADWMEKDSSVKIRIEGHADERGTSEYNLALGERRANASKRYLSTLGIGQSRLSTISYGEEMPMKEGYNEEAWAKNRRVHFEIK
jgi:peptidoglycan-associated lipoprotein